ncbi:putative mitochondrial rna splicing protein [Cryptosporidium felis]|nr:putative mitochondrial rna splicing protein [Cryptosporidium felis]
MAINKHNLFSCIQKIECNLLSSMNDPIESCSLYGYLDIMDRIPIFHIPHPNNNQKPKKIYVNRKECCKLLDISIDEYLFINKKMHSLRPIIKCNGKIIINTSTTCALITRKDFWLLNPENNAAVEIIDKLVDLIGYSSSFDNNTPSTKVSFADGMSKDFISPFVDNSSCNTSLDYFHNYLFEETENSQTNSVLGSFTELNIIEGSQENKSQLLESSPSNISPEKNEALTFRFISTINKDFTPHSFAAVCIEVVLEILNKELIQNIYATKNEAIESCNGLIKNNKWYKYPWRFTFNDFTKKNMISKSVNDLETSVSVLNDCFTEILEEVKSSKNNDGIKLVICNEEWEDILHQFIPALYLASKELVELKSSILFNNELSKVYLDFQRNEYMYTNLKISFLALSCSITSVITGVFGMNLLTGIEQEPIAWYIVTFLVVVPIILWGISSWFTGTLCKRETNYLN